MDCGTALAFPLLSDEGCGGGRLLGLEGAGKVVESSSSDSITRFLLDLESLGDVGISLGPSARFLALALPFRFVLDLTGAARHEVPGR